MKRQHRHVPLTNPDIEINVPRTLRKECAEQIGIRLHIHATAALGVKEMCIAEPRGMVSTDIKICRLGDAYGTKDKVGDHVLAGLRKGVSPLSSDIAACFARARGVRIRLFAAQGSEDFFKHACNIQ
ncbi:hypothetical protein D3C87_1626430 [compost metagenome]